MMSEARIELAIFGFVDRRNIHYATRPFPFRQYPLCHTPKACLLYFRKTVVFALFPQNCRVCFISQNLNPSLLKV